MASILRILGLPILLDCIGIYYTFRIYACEHERRKEERKRGEK